MDKHLYKPTEWIHLVCRKECRIELRFQIMIWFHSSVWQNGKQNSFPISKHNNFILPKMGGLSFCRCPAPFNIFYIFLFLIQAGYSTPFPPYISPLDQLPRAFQHSASFSLVYYTLENLDCNLLIPFLSTSNKPPQISLTYKAHGSWSCR